VSNDNVFRVIADLALKVSNGEHCAILLYDREADEFLPKITGSVDHSLPPHRPWPKTVLRRL